MRFDWQLHDTTSFIRMMSPDAGGTDQVTQNRGYVAIPEVGDQVMVGFVHYNYNTPKKLDHYLSLKRVTLNSRKKQ